MTIVWNEENAAHLYRRTGFGVDPKDVELAVKEGIEKTVERILKIGKTNDKLPGHINELERLQGWWINLMVKTKYPIVERLNLFWHNHFATGFQKVGSAEYMHRQNTIFRAFGMAKFRDLVTEVAKDPAMLIWLDNKSNVKGKQNQNFARELMELFTTGVLDKNGVPNYTENDVNESAKSFTGWQIKDEAFFFNDSKHDFGDKTFKGHTGPFDGTDIINFLAVDPATARRIPAKLFSHFAYEVDLNAPFLDELAQIYLDNDTAILPVLRRILTLDAFYSDQAKTTAIKEPAVFLVWGLRALKAKVRGSAITGSGNKVSVTEIGDRLERMGQSLFDPPTVFGWKTGLTWASAAGMLERAKAGDWISESRDSHHPIQLNPKMILGSNTKFLNAGGVANRLLENFGMGNAGSSTAAALVAYLEAQDNGTPGPFVLDNDTIDKKIRGAIALLMSSAEFQRD
jgi:uncharacterized protein (DUF1800 family)